MEGNFQSCEIKICDNYNTNNENYTKFYALHQQEKIIQTVETVDTLVEWLERSGNDVAENLKKKEAILCGVLRLTGKLVL
jgi:hypothetical protein